MKKMSLVITLVAVTVFAACTKKASPGKAPKVIPTTYITNIAPLIQARCAPCHLPSKGGFKANFENYEGAKKYAADMLTRVMLNPGERGFMPFKSKEKLTEAEISVIKKWMEQGLLEK